MARNMQCKKKMCNASTRDDVIIIMELCERLTTLTSASSTTQSIMVSASLRVSLQSVDIINICCDT